MDFDSCRIDFSDLDVGCISNAAAAVKGDELPWPPIFHQPISHSSSSNLGSCWIKDLQIQQEEESPFISRGNFSSYHSFMEACKREDTIEELLNEQHILKKEILDLHRQNYALENDKEKLINELINFGIAENEDNQEIMEASQNNDEETQTVEQIDPKVALIEELEAKLLKAEENAEKLEKENAEYSDKIFELEMDKQRLNIKLHHYSQVNKNLEENNDELEKEIRKLKAENEKLFGKLENLETKIERIEEGDFEHVSCDDSIVPAVILI
jgi:myosin heavy subunit